MIKKYRNSRRDKRVMFLANLALDYNRKILQGATAYAAVNPDIRLFFSDNFKPEDYRSLKGAHFDGILLGACEQSLELPLQIAATGIAAVDVSGELNPPPLRRIITDDPAVGKLAAEYFLARGFRRFAFYGFQDFHWSNQRRDAFRAVIETKHLEYSEFYISGTDTFLRTMQVEVGMEKYLQSRTQATAVFCANDCLAACLIEACLHAKINIPEQVAILGVDDDHLYTTIRKPRISSIQLQCQRIGFLAMETLAKRIGNRESPVNGTTLVPPGSVISRQSSDIVAVEDDLLRQAIAHIKNNVDKGMNVKQLAYALSVSRTTLENRFAELLSHSPADEIRRQRLGLARDLLESTKLAMTEIARRTGFSSPQLFSEWFRRFAKMTPTAFRHGSHRILSPIANCRKEPKKKLKK